MKRSLFTAITLITLTTLTACITTRTADRLISLIDITVPSLDNVHSAPEKQIILYTATFKYGLACKIANQVAARSDLQNILTAAEIARGQLTLAWSTVQAEQQPSIAGSVSAVDVAGALQRAIEVMVRYYPTLYATEAELAQLREFQTRHADKHGLSADEAEYVERVLAAAPGDLRFQ